MVHPAPLRQTYLVILDNLRHHRTFLKNQRTMLVVGGFPYDTERDVICEKLREIFGRQPGVKEWWARGKVGSVGKVNFYTNDAVWKILAKTPKG